MKCHTHTPAALPPGQRLTVPTEQELYGAHSQYGRFGETRKLLPLLEFVPESFSVQTTHYTDFAIPTNIHS